VTKRSRKEYTECQAFFPVVQIGFPNPSPTRECCSSPTLGPERGTHSLARGGRGTQFRRRDGYSGYSMCTIIALQLDRLTEDDLLMSYLFTLVVWTFVPASCGRCSAPRHRPASSLCPGALTFLGAGHQAFSSPSRRSGSG
jgi:hypothetical protein